jgi:hypothetical protein
VGKRSLWYLIGTIVFITSVVVGVWNNSHPVAAFPSGETVYSDATNTDIVGDDDSEGTFPIGFNFDFYGQTFTDLYASSNGIISFDSGNTSYSNEDLSTASVPDSILAYWDDLYTGERPSGGDQAKNVYYKTVGTAGSRKFIMQWTDHYILDDTDSVPLGTFQAILYEGSNKVQLQYHYLMEGEHGKGGSATIGIAKDNTDFKQFSNNEVSLSSGKAISFIPDGLGGYTMNGSASYDPIYLKTAATLPTPSLSAPTNGASKVSVTPTLSWGAVAGAESYRVFVSTDPYFEHGIDTEEGLSPVPDDSIVYDSDDTTDTSIDVPASSLNPDTRYYWFVQAQTTTDVGISVSDTRNFYTGIITDADGISNVNEDAAPNAGDGNNDGIPDSEQPEVTSFLDPVSGKYAVLDAAGCSANSAVSAAAELQSSADSLFNYPAGLMNFSLACTPGATATITMYYYGLPTTNLVARKYNSTTHTYTTIPGATISSVTIGGQQAAMVVYQITDGSSLDQDGIANGTIVDPAGLGVTLSAPNTGLKPIHLQGYVATATLGFGLLGLSIRRTKDRNGR